MHKYRRMHPEPSRNLIDFMELKGDIQVKFPKYDIFDLRKWVLPKYAKWYLRNQYSGNIQNIDGNQKGGILSYWKSEGASSQQLLAFYNAKWSNRSWNYSGWMHEPNKEAVQPSDSL